MKKHVDYYFLAVSGLLILLGILFLATLSAPASMQLFGNTNYYLFHQLGAVCVGLFFGFTVFKTNLSFLKKISFVLLLTNLVLLTFVFLPVIGTKFWGASRWINIWGTTFQPSEFLKITSILYVATLLSNRFSPSLENNRTSLTKRGYDKLKHVFFPFLCLLGAISVTLLLQRDISTLGITTFTLLVIYFLSKTPLWHTLLSFLVMVLGAIFFIITEPYRVKRLLVFLHPETDPLGIGLQLKQSLIAVGSGGLFGNGLGMSTQKFGFLPQAMSDSVFAVIGEETGIIGSIVLVILFILFLYFGIKIAQKTTDPFSHFTVIGIVCWITFQAFINITSSIGMFPLSGVPLPFFSYGGSHLVAEMIALGLILNISRNS